MSLIICCRVLPAPVHKYGTYEDDNDCIEVAPQVEVRKPKAPAYLQRGNFVPYKIEDYGDGGAFPEIHVVQYPLDMGRPGAKSTAVVSVDVDDKGEVRFDAIVKQGANRTKDVKTSLEDMKESKGNFLIRNIINITDMPQATRTLCNCQRLKKKRRLRMPLSGL